MNKPSVIILNGTGSVGKSSIARALQKMTSEPFLHVRGDSFLSMMPANMWHHPDGFIISHTLDVKGLSALNIQTGAVVERALCGMRAAIAALANEGNNLIVDVIMTNAGEQDDYRRRLGSLRLFFVGLHAPLPVIEEREKNRGDRMEGLARWQYDRVHSGMRYDLEIDTSVGTPTACASQIAAAAGIDTR